jgi:ATP-dependent Lhr-like helicase
MEGVLSAGLHAWFSQRLGQPTAIQRLAWPEIVRGQNILLSAPTGSGKTLAAFLPLIDRLIFAAPVAGVRVLYVSPLKALCSDVRRNLRVCLAGLRPFLPDSPLLPRVALRTGDASPRARQQLWLDPPDILLTTPETLALLLTHTAAADLFGNLRHVVVDEVHALSAGKRGADLSLSLERLERLTRAESLQRIGLSATATPLDEAAQFLTGQDRSCVISQVADNAPLELTLVPLPPGATFLARLLDVVGAQIAANRSTLLFTNTRALTERVAWGLRRRHPEWDEQIAVHHSALAADRRWRVERRLKRGRLRAVVCSTSLELGVDIGSVDLVVLVHPPGDVVRLLQRVGRAGHAPGRPRRGLVLTSGPAELLESAVTASSGQLGQCEPLRVSRQPFDVLCQQLLGMSATRAWDVEEAFALVRRAAPYRDLARADFDACLDYLAGSGDWLASRLRIDDGSFTIRDERTVRILRRNLGTILAEEPCEVVREESDSVRLIGHVDEVFAESLQPGDRFLLDGLCLEFRRLERAGGRAGSPRLVTTELPGRPRVPRWAGEGWPMSPQLAELLFLLRARASEAMREGPESLSTLLSDEYDLSPEAIEEIVSLFVQQELVSEIPDPQSLLIESVAAQSLTMYYLHTPLNRKANDALARVVSLRLARLQRGSIQMPSTVADLGLAIYARGQALSPDDFRVLLAPADFDKDLRLALADSLVLRERFQRVALVALMLLRNPLGRRRRVGGRDWGERRLFDQVQARQPDFVLLHQAEREVLEEVCDLESALRFVTELPQQSIRLRRLTHPSPFVEGWTQLSSVGTPPPTPEEVLRQLHASLTGLGAMRE